MPNEINIDWNVGDNVNFDLSTDGSVIEMASPIIQTPRPSLTLVAGEVIAANKVVRGNLDGKGYKCDANDMDDYGTAIGISRTSPGIGVAFAVAVDGDTITDEFFDFDLGLIYCGADGELTQDPSLLAFSQPVAVALSPTKIKIQIGLAVEN